MNSAFLGYQTQFVAEMYMDHSARNETLPDPPGLSKTKGAIGNRRIYLHRSIAGASFCVGGWLCFEIFEFTLRVPYPHWSVGNDTYIHTYIYIIYTYIYIYWSINIYIYIYIYIYREREIER